MQKIDGFQLYESLKKIDPDVNVCFLTASEMYYGEARRIEHCALNEELFLHKPISTDDLVRVINKKIKSGKGNQHYRSR
jgi:two-component system catabolic regulation response regulator CreB/two-component system response regulator ChvI